MKLLYLILWAIIIIAYFAINNACGQQQYLYEYNSPTIADYAWRVECYAAEREMLLDMQQPE